MPETHARVAFPWGPRVGKKEAHFFRSLKMYGTCTLDCLYYQVNCIPQWMGSKRRVVSTSRDSVTLSKRASFQLCRHVRIPLPRATQ